MRVALILPAQELTSEDLTLVLRGIDGRYANRTTELVLLCIPTTIEHYRRIVTGITAELLSPQTLQTCEEALYLFLPGTKLPLTDGDLQACLPLARSYTIDAQGGIRPMGRQVSEKDDPHLNTHIFNYLAPSNPAHAQAYSFFPWSWLYREPSWGPINEFGHRIGEDFRQYAERAPGHFLIGGFGGSAAFGWECLAADIWTACLERLLNEHCQNTGIPATFTVLNFASGGHTILNEIFHYILFCHRLSFDLVITLDGTNDLWNGQMSDPYLLERSDITYQETQEAWAKMLHGAQNRQTRYSTETDILRSTNPPGINLRAYVTRIRQFRHLAESDGARFLWGLQPMLFSRPHMSPQEELIKNNWGPRDEKPRADLPKLFNLLSQNLPKDCADIAINHHEIFSRYSDNQTLFWDIVHPNPEGQSRIASNYFEHIRDRILPSLIEERAHGRQLRPTPT
ncbi:SGNH/GDSL hydrolase family protein [uncultured Gammaproteobacteria bacterium]|nr:hypothetical protein [Pseudomonadota bacterium]